MAKKKGQGTSNKAAPASVGTTNGKHHINRKNPETRKEEQEERQRILRENEMERQAQLAKYKKAYSGTGDPTNFGTQRPPGEHNMPPNGNGGQMMFDTTSPAVHKESEEVDDTNYTHENSIVPAHRPPLSLPDRAPPSVVGHGKTYTVPMGTGGGMDLAAQSLMRMGAGTPKVGQSQATATINMSMIAGDANWRQHSRLFVKDHLFKKVKFWKSDKYGAYSLEPNSVCGMFASLYSFGPGVHMEGWWMTVKQMVVQMLTDRRNNVIKTIRKKFLGKFSLHDNHQL